MQSSPLRIRLQQLAEPAYRDFARRLIPGESRLLGVRLPILRKLAQQYARGHWRALLNTPQTPDTSFEEILLRAMLPAYATDTTLSERLHYLAREQPNLNNWSLCDSACATCRFVRNHRHDVALWLTPFLRSADEFTARFGVVMLNTYYATEADWVDWVIDTLPKVRGKGYYADMAVAWCGCSLLCRFPERAEKMLTPGHLAPNILKLLHKKLRESRITPPTFERANL